MRTRHWRDRESCWCLTTQSTCPGEQNSLLFSFILSVSSLLLYLFPLILSSVHLLRSSGQQGVNTFCKYAVIIPIYS